MFTKFLPLLLLFFTLFFNFMVTTSGQECPYPCYPPPTGPVNNPPLAITPPPSPPQGSNYNNFPPPSSGGGGGYNNFPPPSSGGSGGGYNNFPYNSPPNNGYVNGLVPPPPDPILPWWPYRYRNRTDQFSSSSSIQESRNMMMMNMITIIVPMFSLFFTLLFH